MTGDDIEAEIRELAHDATRYALGHAIAVIDEYAAEHPDAMVHCVALASTLRRHSALLGMDGSE